MMRVTYIILQISTDGETVVGCLYVPHKHVLLSLFLNTHATVPVPGLLTLWTAATIERPERVVARRVTRPVGMAGDGMKASALSRERRRERPCDSKPRGHTHM